MSPTKKEKRIIEWYMEHIMIFIFFLFYRILYTLLIPFGKFVFVTQRNCVATEHMMYTCKIWTFSAQTKGARTTRNMVKGSY